MVDDPPWWRAPSVISALGALVVVVVADVVLKSLSGTPSDFSLFIGRLHPLAVHLPIGIVLLVGAAEAATLSPRLRPRLDPAIALALPILVMATVGAFVFGHLLARAGDFSPKALLAHRRAEFFAAVGICLCPVVWAYQARAQTAAARLAYRGVLGLTIAVLSLGAHFGGTLTRGESYLGRYAPGPLKGLLGGGEAKPASTASARPPGGEPRLYADVIQPILERRCGSCHGAEKSKGGLRLDSLGAIQKGGEEDGPALIAFEPERSPLLARVRLPKEHEDHMPPEDKPQPTAAELAALSFWIERGGSDTLLVRDLLAPAEARSVLEQALSKAPKAAGSAEPPSPPASSTPPDTAPSAKTPTAVAPSDAATASPPESAPSDPTPRAPSPAAKPSDDEPSGASPSDSAPPAGVSSASGILAERCAKCHGASKQKSRLRVDSLDALLRGGKSGPAIVPGEPRASALLQAIQKPLDDEQHMPPKKEPQLTPREIAVITAWIRSLKPSATAAPGATAPAPPSAPSPPSAAPAPPSTPSPPSAAPVPAAAPAPAPAPAFAAASDPPSPELLATLPPRLALYPSQIAPLLREHCEHCHSGSAPSGGLSVESHAALLQGGDTGPAIVPGKPEASELVRRISLPPGDSDRMPPEGSPELSADDIALVTAWVERDAGEGRELALQTLPAAAVRAIAAHPPTRSRDAVASASPHARGGCGACVASGRDAEPSFAGYAAGAFMLGLTVRRVRRRAAA